MGGQKSGEARREKKKLKDALKALLELKGDKGQTNQQKLCLALFEKALKGDVQAFNAIRDTIGEKPVEKIENKSSYKPITSETAQQIAKDVFGIE